jgi:hypothetical protein
MFDEKNAELLDIYTADFTLHVAGTSLMLLIKHLIDGAKPEEKEVLKTIPNQLIDAWERNRINALNDTPYINGVMDILKNSSLKEDELKSCMERLKETEKQTITNMTENYRKAFNSLKVYLNG